MRRRHIAREGFKAVAAAPLVVKGVVHGALAVHQWTARTFSDDEMALLALLAEQAALALENARLYAEARRRGDRLRELAQLEQMVAASLDPDAVLRAIAEAAGASAWTRTSSRCGRPTTPPARAASPRVQRRVRAGRRSRRRSRSATASPAAPRSCARPSTSRTSRASRDRCPRSGRAQSGIQRLLAVPMLSGDDLLGVVTVRSRSDSLASDEDRALITMLASQAAMAVQNAGAYAAAVARGARLQALVSLTRSFTASLDTADVIRRIVDAAVVDAAARARGRPRARHRARAAAGDRVAGDVDAAAGAGDARRAPRPRDDAAPARARRPAARRARARSRPRGGASGRPPRTTACRSWWATRSWACSTTSSPRACPIARSRRRSTCSPRTPASPSATRRSTRPSTCSRRASARWPPSTSASRARSISTRCCGRSSRARRSSPASASRRSGWRTIARARSRSPRTPTRSSWPRLPRARRRRTTRARWAGSRGTRSPSSSRTCSATSRMLSPDWWRRNGLRSFAGFPVVADGELLAVLALCHTQPVTLTPSLRDVVDMFLAQAAVAIRNARLYRDAGRRRDVAEALARHRPRALLHARRRPHRGARPERHRRAARRARRGRSTATRRATTRCARWSRTARAARRRRALVLRRGEGVAGRAVSERRVVVSADILNDPDVIVPPDLRAEITRLGPSRGDRRAAPRHAWARGRPRAGHGARSRVHGRGDPDAAGLRRPGRARVRERAPLRGEPARAQGSDGARETRRAASR